MFWVWTLFIIFVIICLILDLKVFNKDDHVIETKEAGKYTALWVSVALAFSGVIWWLFSEEIVENPTELTPTQAVLDYITGYLVEISLSIDNLFVIAVIFTSFQIPQKYQHRVLFWGIVGAVVFRALMILFGIALINKFGWIIYVFGAFLIYTAITMLKEEKEKDPRDSWLYKQIAKILPLTQETKGHDFFINGKATVLFVALIIIEFTDIMFALDSIPAILAITQDEFIAFSSNILAIIGLRSMYFLVVGMLKKFYLIHYSLAAILAFIGVKMLLSHVYHISSIVSLIVIATALTAGVLASLYIWPKKDTEDEN